MSTSNPSGRQHQLGTIDKEALRAKSQVTVTAHNLVKMEREVDLLAVAFRNLESAAKKDRGKIRRVREAERKLKGALES